MKLYEKLRLKKHSDMDKSEDVRRSRIVKKGFKNLSSVVTLLIAAPLLAILITSHVFHSYEVEGLSMETTLQNGDRLIVYKLPKTIANIGGNSYLPERNDIIVFDRPTQINAPKSVRHLIKRVVALPGERITVKDGQVTVYNNDFPNGFNPDEGQDYAKDTTDTPGNVDITIGQTEVFVLGDNRINSSDSRVFGPIDVSTIVGVATIRFIPTNAMRRL
jgi:signal peptidase I